MYKKGYIVGSICLFIVAAGLAVAGVVLFRSIPFDVVDLTARQSLMVVGLVFAFIFSVISLGIAVWLLIAGLNNRYRW